MASFRFVHSADLHLGTPLQGLTEMPPSLEEILRTATLTAWEQLVAFCLEEQVDFLCLAGDIYDEKDRNLTAQLAFLQGCERLAEGGIPVYMVHGNHDPLDGRQARLNWPSNLHLFSAEAVSSFPVLRGEEEIACIYGRSYPTRHVTENFSLGYRRQSEAFAIGLLHANVGNRAGHENYAPCSLDDLRQGEMDYWALGHIHQPQVLQAEFPTIIYPGNLQGRHWKEQGERGCYLVEVEGMQVTPRFQPLQVMRWEEIAVQLDGVEREQELVERLIRTAKKTYQLAGEEPVILRLCLEGRTPFYGDLLEPMFLQELQTEVNQAVTTTASTLWVAALESRCRPAYLPEVPEHSFAADVLRILREWQEDWPQHREPILAIFSELKERRLWEHEGLLPSEEELQQLVAELEPWLLHLMMEGGTER